jgi:outer membrane protein OmpA-like peptidoglycan-associated protein
VKKYFLLLLFLSFSFISFGQKIQQLKENHCDCENAITIPPYIWGPTSAPVSSGETMEIDGAFVSLTAFDKEHHTVWYRFRVEKNCIMSFDIIPINQNDDYDFLLYKIDVVNICDAIISNSIKPIRACISRNDKSIQSKTGLGKEKTNKYEHSGVGNSYVAPVKVKAGEEFILVLDNVYPNGEGHAIHFDYSNCEKDIIIPNNNESVQILSISVIDKETKKEVSAKIKVKENTNKQVFENEGVSTWSLPVNTGEKYTISILSSGYMLHVVDFEAGETENKLVFELQKIQKDSSIYFNNILFAGNQAIFLEESYEELELLLLMMIENPSLEIEIQGHVNCPYDMCVEKMTESNQLLSNDRARAVYDFLISNDVSSERIQWKGYSNSKMLYPYARDERQMKFNRRVEIKILKN